MENEIDLEYNNNFSKIVKKYLPVIEVVKKEVEHWKIDNKIIKPRKRSERGDLINSIFEKINSEQRLLKKKEYQYRYIAFRLSHIPTKDLYFIDKEYVNNALFFWSIKSKNK